MLRSSPSSGGGSEGEPVSCHRQATKGNPDHKDLPGRSYEGCQSSGHDTFLYWSA